MTNPLINQKIARCKTSLLNFVVVEHQVEIERKQVKWKGFVLEYLVFGKGEHPVLCLHGHAKSAEDYLFLEPVLPGCKFISINLFFHGASDLPKEKDFSHPVEVHEWKAIIEQLFQQEKLEEYSIIAYSLGGRWAFNLLQLYPSCIRNVVLLAPDGLNKNGWYHRTSGSWVLRSLFRRIVRKPKSFLTFLNILRRARLISERLHQFLFFHLETREKREKAYRTWMMYRKLFPNHQKLKKLLATNTHEKHLILGEFDAIISLKHSRKFLKLNEGNVVLHIIPSGHDFFKTDQQEAIVEIIQGVFNK